MRVVAGLAALALLAGCDGVVEPIDQGNRESNLPIPADATAFANPGSPFDYRYAFRLPGNRLKAVLQSNADGCDRLGPARCRIVAMRYKVDDTNRIAAVLTFKIDPGIARSFGDAATHTVTSAEGVLTDTEIAGAESTAAARSTAIVARLREQLANAEAVAKDAASDADRARAQGRAERIRGALDTIAEVEADTGQTAATAPVLMTYESNNAISSLGSNPDVNFNSAGQTLVNSLASLAQVLAGVGPWLVMMILVVAALRWVVQNTGTPAEPEAPARPSENRGIIRRWFHHDEEAAEHG